MNDASLHGRASEPFAAAARRAGDPQDLHNKVLRRMALVETGALVELLSVCAFGPLNNEWYTEIEYLITNALSVPHGTDRPAPSEKDLVVLFRLARQLKLSETWGALASPTDDLATSVATHGIAVRVKADVEQMLQESLDRFSPHDDWMTANLGFGGESPALFAREVLSASHAGAERAFAGARSARRSYWEEHTHRRKVYGEMLHLPDSDLTRRGIMCLRLRRSDLEAASVLSGCQAELDALLSRLSQELGRGRPMISSRSRSSLYDRPFVVFPDGSFVLPLATALAECVSDTFLDDMLKDSTYRASVLDAKGGIAEERCLRVLDRAAQEDFVFPNPRRANGKEFADALIWVGDTLAIVQAKSRRLPTKDGTVDLGALTVYVRKTVHDAVKQARGARRRLYDGEKVAVENPRRGRLSLDGSLVNKVFLVIILDERLPFSTLDELGVKAGAQPDDFPHIFYLNDLELILAELDTPTDFFQYLEARDELQRRGKYDVGDEMDILAYYLLHGRSFAPVEKEEEVGWVNLDGFWKSYTEPGGLRDQRHQADGISYYIDSVIDFAHTAGGRYVRSAELLAKLTRLERRMVAKRGYEKAVAAIGSPHPRYDALLMDRAGFGLLLMYSNEERSQRKQTLHSLTTLAQHTFGIPTMLGVASEPASHRETSFDFVRIDIPNFTPDPHTQALARQFFALQDILSESEYPAQSAGTESHESNATTSVPR